MKQTVFFVLLLFTAVTVQAEEVSIQEFESLSRAEQDKVLLASYRTATVLLALGGIGRGEGKLAPEKMAACLKERNVDWLRSSFVEHMARYPGLATDFGATFARSMAWKCGLLKIETDSKNEK